MIFVLWAIVILSIVVLGFSKDTRLSVQLESTRAERMKGLYAARGATLYALVRLAGGENDSAADSVSNQQVREGAVMIAPGDLPKAGTAPVDGDAGIVDNDDGGENPDVVKGAETRWTPGRDPYSVQVGDIDCDVYLSYENGKININGINDENREILTTFLIKKGVDLPEADIIADSVLDWIDDDDLTHLNGAEDKYYESLPDPYKSKDGPLSSIEEMTLIRGVTPEIFETIKDSITVYGERNINVNVNIASGEILSSIPGLSDDIVEELSLYIEENGMIRTSEELREIFWRLGVIGDSFEDIKSYLTLDESDFVAISAVCGGVNGMPENSGESYPLNTQGSYSEPDRQSSYRRYDYKLIAGKKDKGYKIYAVYPE